VHISLLYLPVKLEFCLFLSSLSLNADMNQTVCSDISYAVNLKKFQYCCDVFLMQVVLLILFSVLFFIFCFMFELFFAQLIYDI